MCHSRDISTHLRVLSDPDKQEKALFPGLFFKRMMGLEPTTFCMANPGGTLPEAKLREDF
jgi:hypothetical protein